MLKRTYVQGKEVTPEVTHSIVMARGDDNISKAKSKSKGEVGGDSDGLVFVLCRCQGAASPPTNSRCELP